MGDDLLLSVKIILSFYILNYFFLLFLSINDIDIVFTVYC